MTRFILILILALSGCGKDRTVEDLNAQKQDQAQHETQQALGGALNDGGSIDGAFNGILISKMTGKPMGSLSVSLSGDTEIPDASTGDSSDGNVGNSLTADITLTTSAFTRTITATGGIFNIYSHNYQFDFTIENGQITGTTPQEIKFRMSGKIDPQTKVMDGTLRCIDYVNYGGSFRLTQGATISALASASVPTSRADAVMAKTYSVTQDILGADTRVTLKMSREIPTLEGGFLDLFYPIRFVTLTARFTETSNGMDLMTIAFPNGQWNMQSKTLSGTTNGVVGSGTGQPYNFTILCKESGTTKTPGWNCQWTGSSVFNFNVKAVR